MPSPYAKPGPWYELPPSNISKHTKTYEKKIEANEYYLQTSENKQPHRPPKKSKQKKKKKKNNSHKRKHSEAKTPKPSTIVTIDSPPTHKARKENKETKEKPRHRKEKIPH